MPKNLPDGFHDLPKSDAQGKVYRGRFVCPAVQWIGEGDDIFCTFTITAAEVADAAATRLLWTDQAVQRGIKPGLLEDAPRELSLSDGYPDSRYIFDAENANDMVEKLLTNQKVYLNPLVWNLRPKAFTAFWDKNNSSIYLYSGKVFLPDSHHRHQAIAKAVHIFRDSPDEYPNFSEDRQFKVELYFLNRESEGDYFFDKNQRPKPTAQSKAYDLSTLDDLSVLAKEVIERSEYLKSNVNRVTDRLTQSNPQVLTLSTLREMMRTFTAGDYVDPTELEGLSIVAAEFYDMLASVRPELGHLDRGKRKHARERLIVDAAVMMHGYAAIMRDYNNAIGKLGRRAAQKEWNNVLKNLSSDKTYSFGKWSGDFFEKRNPLWEKVGVIRTKEETGKSTVLNTGGARGACGRVLRQFLSMDKPPSDLSFLAKS